MSAQRLPMADPAPGPGEPRTGSERAAPPAPPSTSAARLVATLAFAGALAGLAIVLVYQWALPRIEAYQARVLAEAVTEVLGGPERYETVFLENGVFTATPQADTSGLDRIYVGYDATDAPMGVAMVHAESGFQDVIRVIFGYDPTSGKVLGMKVLESKETPGLGDKIFKDTAFVAAFGGVAAPIQGVKKGAEEGTDAEVVMITGATISSRAVIDIINHRVAALRESVGAYWTTSLAVGGTRGSPPPTPAAGGGA